MDEHACIDAIRRALAQAWRGTPSPSEVLLGIGDDAAVIATEARPTVLSVDSAVENVHFRRDWLSPADLGHRAVSAAISDLAAMGARPRAGLTSLIVPTHLPQTELMAIIDGIAAASRDYLMPIVGGNLARGSELSLTTTVVGEGGSNLLRRDGARPGDVLYVTGHPGEAALGLTLLQTARVERPNAERFITRWRRPVARITDGLALREVATSAIDLSDGLLQDLAQLCDASGVGAHLVQARLPLDATYLDLCAQLDLEPLELALGGGEDYELLFSAPPDRPLPIAASPIGTIEAQTGVRLVDPQGRARECPIRGHRHPIGS